MSLINRDDLIQALRDNLDKHGLYRHAYEKLGIEQLVLNMESATPDGDASTEGLTQILAENCSLKQKITHLQGIIDDNKFKIKLLEERAKLYKPSTVKKGHWKKSQRFRLKEDEWGGLKHEVINVYVCDNCGHTLTELSKNVCACPKCGSLNELFD